MPSSWREQVVVSQLSYGRIVCWETMIDQEMAEYTTMPKSGSSHPAGSGEKWLVPCGSKAWRYY